jgi:hypothetical protein
LNSCDEVLLRCEEETSKPTEAAAWGIPLDTPPTYFNPWHFFLFWPFGKHAKKGKHWESQTSKDTSALL